MLPFFHVTSMQGGMNAPMYQGSTIVLMCRWDREVAAELIQRYKLTSWTAISTMVIDFLANPRSTNTTCRRCSACPAAARRCRPRSANACSS